MTSQTRDASAADGAAGALDRAAAAIRSGPWVPMAVAAVLGVHRIAERSIWLDEAFSWTVTRLPTLELWRHLWDDELHASPYYVLLQPWTALGTDEATLRLLSVVFGVVAVALTWAIGRRFGVGVPAALLLAVAPFFVEFQQEARGYTMLAATSALATLLWLRAVERPTRLRWLPYVLVAGATIYVHPLGALVPVAHAVSGLAFDRIPLRRLALVFAPVVVLWLPMVRFSVTHRDKIAWIEPLTVTSATDHLLVLGGGVVVAGALVALVASGVRRDVSLPWLLVPIAGTLLISAFVQPALQGKYIISVLPAAAIIAARNARPAVAMLIGLSLVGVVNWYEHGQKDDWRAGAAWVEARIQPGDGIVFATANMRLPFGYYAELGDPLYPALPWSEVYLPDRGTPVDVAAFDAYDRIWLVLGHGRDAPAEVWQALEPFRVAELVDFGRSGPRIESLVRASDSP